MSVKEDILEVIQRVDVDLLKEQCSTLEGMLTWITSEIDLGSVDEEVTERLESDKDNIEGLVEFLDSLICALEEIDSNSSIILDDEE
jgi:hypothetical protein